MQKPIGTLIREVILIFGIVVVVAGGVWLFSPKTEQRPTITDSIEKTSPVEKQSPPAFLDTDGDGLLDWEEALWGTDPKNKDTDRDGTSDGTEVSMHRDPKKAGPRDSLETPIAVKEQEEKQPPPYQNTAPPLVRGTQTPNVAPTEPKKVPSEDPLYIFGNAIGVFIQAAAKDSEAELAFWNSAAGNKKMNGELISGFSKLAQKYETLATNIASIVPPSKGAEAHAALARAYQNYAKAVRGIAETKEGAYMSGEALTAYANATLALGHAFVDVSDLFYREGIRFDKTEPGAIFMFPR